MIGTLSFRHSSSWPWSWTLKQLLCFGLALSIVGLKTAAAAALPAAPSPNKQDIINRLKDIQTRQSSELQSLDDGIKKRVAETTTVSLKSSEAKLMDRRIIRISGQIDDLAQRRAEYAARRDFLSNLIFVVDTKWTGQPLNTFLEHTFLDMAMTDIADSRSHSRLWKFYVYSSIAVREIPEPREDVLNVLESYINFANVLDPKTPALFLENRSYTNGSLSYSAKTIPREHVGDNVDKKLKELSQIPVDPSQPKAPPAKAPADIELRLPPLAGSPAADDAGTVSGTTGAVDPANASDEQPKAKPAMTTLPLTSPSPSRRALPKNLPPINPSNGAAVPPPPPTVPGQKN